MAVGTLAAYSVGGPGKLAIAQTKQSAKQQAGAADPEEALPKQRYNIAPGTLRSVIPAFQDTSGLQIEVSVAELLTLQCAGVSGNYTIEQALKILLSGTGLDYVFGSDRLVTLELKTATTSVDINDLAPILASSLSKYQQALTDIPQTVSVVSNQVLQQQGSTTLRDALRNVAGISLAAGEGGAQGDNLTIRGFTARNDLFIDGMRDFGSYYRDPFNTEEVEVLQGPSSVTFGRGSTGGIVNQASKTPNLNRFISADLQFGTDATRRAAIDLNVPLPKLGSGAAFRLNAMGDIGGVAGRDIAENRRLGFAPSLALGLGTPTRITFSYFHQNGDDIPDYGLPWLFNGPAPVNRNNYYGLKDANFLRTYDDIGTVKVEHDISSKVTLRNQIRYANYGRAALITEAQVPAPPAVTPLTPLAAIQITRHEIGVNSTETFFDEQLDLTAHFKTGGIRHTLIGGIEAGHESSDPTRPNFTAPTTGLLNPNPFQALIGSVTTASQVNDSAVSVGAYVIDTVDLGKHWEVTGGGRFDRFDDSYSQTVAPSSNFRRADQKPTWRAAVVYKPVSFGSIYFDAGTSFNPSAETLSLSAGTANLPPETNKTYEFGTKWAMKQNRLTLNTSWFRTTKENAREADPTNSLLYVLAGTQRVDGAEVDARGRITSRWDILASYAYLDSRVVNSKFYPGAVGFPLANVPKNTFAYWSAFHLPEHLELGAGANYESSRTASSTVPLDPTTGLVKEVPGYWVFNAMVGHPISEHIDLQLNVYNLADRFYYDQIHPAHIVPGAGRSALIDLKFKF